MNEAAVFRAWSAGSALELAVELGGEKEVVTGQFDGFHAFAVGTSAGEAQATIFEDVEVFEVNLEAVAMTLVDFRLFVQFVCHGIFVKYDFVCT